MQWDWEGQPRGKGGLFASGKMPKNESKMLSLSDNIDKVLGGTETERAALQRTHFKVAETGQLLKELGLTGSVCTASYGVISHHKHKDADHDFTANEWRQICSNINKPFAVTKYGEGYNIFLKGIRTDKDVLVGMVVKQTGKGSYVNAIKTVFAKNFKAGDAGVIYTEKKTARDSIFGRNQSPSIATRAQKERRPQHDGDKITPGNNVRNGTAPMVSIPHSPKKSTPFTNNFDGGNTMTTSTTTNRTILAFMLKQRLATMTPTERGAHKRTKPPRWLYPAATEALYARYYRAWIKPVKEYVYSYIAEHQAAILRGDSTQVVRTDAIPGLSFIAMINALTGWVAAQFGDKVDKNGQISLGDKVLYSPVHLGLGDIAESAFNFNSDQWKKSVKYSLGIDFPSDESWWAVARDLWQKQNYDIIKSDIRKYISDINRLTEEAVTNGTGYKPLAKKIQALDTSITKSRAAFIARDQIGKLNGQITQRRMESEGLTMYTWQTGGDERVRPSHALMNGKLCRWDDATVYSEDGGKTWIKRPSGAVLLHPGQDYQCRCTALAYFEELMGEASAVEKEPPKTYIEKLKAGKWQGVKKVQKELSVVNTEMQKLQEKYGGDVLKNGSMVHKKLYANLVEEKAFLNEKQAEIQAKSQTITIKAQKKAAQAELDKIEVKTYTGI